MYVSIKDLASLTTMCVFLTAMFAWAEILATAV